MDVVQRFEAFYQTLDTSSANQLKEVYADSAVLVDPAGRHCGLEAIENYFNNLLQNTNECTCKIKTLQQGNNQCFVIWEMTLRHNRLNNGRTFVVEGTTHIKLQDDMIVYHRDYFDLGQMLYERLPILKHLILTIKKRLTQ